LIIGSSTRRFCSKPRIDSSSWRLEIVGWTFSPICTQDLTKALRQHALLARQIDRLRIGTLGHGGAQAEDEQHKKVQQGARHRLS
jgi:hypothetical protein